MVSSEVVTASDGEITLSDRKSLELWKIRARAYFRAQRITDERIAMRDAFLSAQVRFNIDPKEDVEDSFKTYNKSIGYRECYPMKEYLKSIREKHKEELNNG